MLRSAAERSVGRYRLAVVLLLALAPALAVQAVGRADPRTTDVSAEDDFFQQDVVRIPVGGSVQWTNEGDNLHNVIADDGSFRSSTISNLDYPPPASKANTRRYIPA